MNIPRSFIHCLIVYPDVKTLQSGYQAHITYPSSATLVDLEGIHVKGDDFNLDSVIRHDNTQVRIHAPTVTIPVRGGEVYKATLVSLLNQDPHLSGDR